MYHWLPVPAGRSLVSRALSGQPGASLAARHVAVSFYYGQVGEAEDVIGRVGGLPVRGVVGGKGPYNCRPTLNQPASDRETGLVFLAQLSERLQLCR
jgi:hypothetical protein